MPARDGELVARALQAVGDFSNLAAARELGISEATVRRWRAGGAAVPLRTATRLALRRYLTSGPRAGERPWREPARAEGGGVERAVPPADGAAGERILELCGSVDRIAGYIASIASAGEEQARKLDALFGLRRMIAPVEPIPDWWYRLRERVRAGEL